MKDLGKYVAGLTGVILFIYLLETGEKDLATQLFYALLSVFSIIFGLEHGKNNLKIETQEKASGKNPFKTALLKTEKK